MNQHDIQELVSSQSNPKISILVSLSPDAVSDSATIQCRVKNLMRPLEEKLRHELTGDEFDDLQGKLAGLVSEIDCAGRTRGVAIFVNRELARIFYLDFPVRERGVVGNSFAVRGLLRGLNETVAYYVLVLSREIALLYRGEREELTALDFNLFPVLQAIPRVKTEWTGQMPPFAPHGGVDPDQYRTRTNLDFMRRVDAVLEHVYNLESLPLVVAAVEENLGDFHKVSKHNAHVVAQLTGSFVKTPPHELGRQVWPLMQMATEEKRNLALQEWENAIGEHEFAEGLLDVWSAAQLGQVDTLLADDSCQFPVLEAGSDGSDGESASPPIVADALDEVVEAVLKNRGKAVFLERGDLAHHGNIAAVLRYPQDLSEL